MLLCYGTFFSNTTEKWVVLVFDCEIAVVHTGPVFPYTFPPVFPYTFSIIFSSASWSFVFLLMCRVNLNFLRAFFCCCASGTFFSDANENWVVLVLFCEIAVVHTSPVPVWESFRFHWGIAVQAEVSFRTALAKKWKKRIFLDRFLDLSFPLESGLYLGLWSPATVFYEVWSLRAKLEGKLKNRENPIKKFEKVEMKVENPQKLFLKRIVEIDFER